MVLRSLTSFGRVDAESDNGLADFFVETPSYQSIENQQRLVVVGRKGAGKTAIHSMLLEGSKKWSNVFVAGLDFRNYPWELHAAAGPSESSGPEQYAPLWQLLILVELSKLVLRDGPQQSGREAWQARRSLKRFIKRNWGGVDARVSQMFTRSSYSLTVEPKALGFSLFSFRRERVPKERLAGSLGNVNSALREVLKKLMVPDISYFVLLDDLDGGFSGDDRVSHNRLIALLMAARESQIWAQKAGLKFLPVVFMRSDIYAALKFPTKNRITADALERIAWSEQKTGPASLRKLIDKRIEAAISYDSADPWHEVFLDGDLIDSIPLYEFMAARTHRRPRDMIRLANGCLEEANREQAARIGAEHVLAALPKYATYLLDEISDAAHQSVPDWEEHLMTLRRMETIRFDRAAFAAEHEKGPSEASVDHALRDLYLFGVIGYTQGKNVVYAHYNDAGLDAGATHFEVHPGLWPELGPASPDGRPGEGDRGQAVG